MSKRWPLMLLLLAPLAIGCSSETGDADGSAIPSSNFGAPTPADAVSVVARPASGSDMEIPSASFGNPNAPSTDAEGSGREGGDARVRPDTPCLPGDLSPCTCESGATGLRLCDEDNSPCDCLACPGEPPPAPSGLLKTSKGQFLFDGGHLQLAHRRGELSGGAGCVVSASMSFYAGEEGNAGCLLSLQAFGDLNPDGTLPLTSLTLEADQACLGLGAGDHGSYVTTDFVQGTLTLNPSSVEGGADAECWSGSMTATIEALITRTDGYQLTVSVSTLQLDGSGLSVGTDAACPELAEFIDINDCDKAVPLTVECNPYCQLGCDAGEHCVVDNGSFRCRPIGSIPHGAGCTDAGSCAFGVSCFELSSEGFDRCHTPCIDDDDCPNAELCNTTATIGPQLSLSICTAQGTSCDPLGESACDGGEACYLNGSVAECAASGTLPLGAVCHGQGLNACAPGLHCLVTCRELCSTGDQAPSCWSCPGGHHEVAQALSLGFCVEQNPPALCDPYAQTGCALGEGCYPVPGGIACRSAGPLGPSEPCQTGNSCTPGYACVNAKCQQLCELNAPDSNPTSCEARCGEAMGAILPEVWQIGVCLDF